VSEHPEATNLRNFLLRINEGLLAQAEGVESLSTASDIPHTLRRYAGQLGTVADEIRYDGTVDWANIPTSKLPHVMLEPTLPQLVGQLHDLTTEIEERLDNLRVPDDEELRTSLNDLESRIDTLEHEVDPNG
jgi:hypothetical protein